MTATTLPARRPAAPFADRALKASGAFWYAVTAIGQLAFVAYIVLFYGRATLAGDFERWNDVLVGGYRTGDPVGNTTLGLHLLLAAVITAGGLLQLLPALRHRVPALHRWNGRVFLAASLLASVGGLYLVWTRDGAGALSMDVGISLNGVLILIFGVQAWRLAVARRIEDHRRWALRTFVLVSGVWFFRVGMMGWILANGGRPVGIGETFDGPFVRTLAFACYLLPLAGVELWLRAQRLSAGPAKLAAAGAITGLTLFMALGVVGTIIGMWLPRIF